CDRRQKARVARAVDRTTAVAPNHHRYVSFFGNASSVVGRNRRWPGEPNAPSDVTLYGPGSASGAPSTGNARSIIARVMPGDCARHKPALVSSAAAAATMVLCMSPFPPEPGLSQIEINGARAKLPKISV